MRASLFLCGGLLAAAAVDLAPAQTPGPPPSQQPPMSAPQPTVPAPVIHDRGGEIATGRPPPAPAPVRHDPAGSTLSPLPCRDGTYPTTIDGKPATVKGRLCEQPDGTWAPKR
ncbi:MAG TPA: hypothetical protein VMH36_02360 [Alphaproteobacteria bacterium]|nr:hypothetical protein [Alphaproteobacteria bacterium]